MHAHCSSSLHAIQLNATQNYYSMLSFLQKSWQLDTKMQKLMVSAFWCAAAPFWLFGIWQKFWGTKLDLSPIDKLAG
jgi:hypothetical protein